MDKSIISYLSQFLAKPDRIPLTFTIPRTNAPQDSGSSFLIYRYARMEEKLVLKLTIQHHQIRKVVDPRG